MSTLAEPHRVPLEVAENIIDALGASRDANSLRNCALTCRGWHPRARYHLMASICIRSREDLSSILDYFDSTPDIAGAVWSLALYPEDHEHSLFLRGAIPIALFSRFPNLRSYRINGHAFANHSIPPISFYPNSLVGLKAFLLEELSLTDVVFRTGTELARLLIALCRLRRLDCKDVSFKDQSNPVTSATHLARLRNRCSTLLELSVSGHTCRGGIAENSLWCSGSDVRYSCHQLHHQDGACIESTAGRWNIHLYVSPDANVNDRPSLIGIDALTQMNITLSTYPSLRTCTPSRYQSICRIMTTEPKVCLKYS